MKKKFLLLFIIFTQITFAQRKSKKRMAYIEKYKNIAIKEMEVYNIPASITLAQGILESGDGKSELAKKSNNHFGIKCHRLWNGEKVYHDDDEEQECFRKYDDPWLSYRDHSKFLASRKRYAELFKLEITDYKGWAHGLKKKGYATLDVYAERLIQIIEHYDLHKYDKMSLNAEENKILTHKMNKLKDIKEITDSELINDLRYVFAENSLIKISNKYNIPIQFLMDYNDLEKPEDLQKNQIIYLERKKIKYTGKKIHLASSKETLYQISQKYGIRIKWLRKRNSLEKESILKKGTQIYLTDFKSIHKYKI